MKHITKILLNAVALAVSVSCIDEYKSDFRTEKPEKVAQYEYLADYDVLKMYIDRNANSGFKLGTGVTVSDFLKKETAYSLAYSNFDEVTAANAMKYGSVVTDDGSMDFTTVRSFVETAEEAGITVYGHTLCWHSQQNNAYLNGLIAPVIIPPESSTGTTLIADFESNAIGDTYPMTGNGAATVVADPAGKSGNVLNVGGPANNSYPKINVVLPEGRKLGDYKTMKLDFYGTGSSGLYGSGMRFAINDVSAAVVYGSPSSFGCPDGGWGRGYIILPLANLNLTAAQKELTEFTLITGSGTGAGNYYIDNIIMEWESLSSGTTSIADFESNGAGDTYPMSGNGAATVVADPAGKSGNVLNVGGPANYSYPVFNVTLPDGRKLGDYKTVKLDFYGTGSSGLYGSGMRLAINDVSAAVVYGSPSSFGCPDGGWGRGYIILPLANLNLTEEQKELTEFTLITGSGTGSGNYYIDNIAMDWESAAGDQIIEKTPEEKKEIITNALEAWIAGMMETCNGYVKAWDAVNEPMDDDNPSELKSDPTQSDVDNFYWQDYLGRDYARAVIRLARQYGGADLKLFVNDYNLEVNSQKCDGLIKMIEYWESDGVTRIDGIGTQLHLIYSLDATKQAANEEGIKEMFGLLTATGKLLRISALDMKIEDAGGVEIEANSLTSNQQLAASGYFNFVVRQYFEIPADKRYGITLNHAMDNGKYIGLWDTGYNRKHTYSGFADGLAGKTGD
jgi:GH35 family endo-1,4-beta-xylanase